MQVTFSGTHLFDIRKQRPVLQRSFEREFAALPRKGDYTIWNRTAYLAECDPADDQKYFDLAAKFQVPHFFEQSTGNAVSSLFQQLVPNLMYSSGLQDRTKKITQGLVDFYDDVNR